MFGRLNDIKYTKKREGLVVASGVTHTLLVFLRNLIYASSFYKTLSEDSRLGISLALVKMKSVWGAQQVKCLPDKRKGLSLGPQGYWYLSVTSVWGQAETSRSQWIAG